MNRNSYIAFLFLFLSSIIVSGQTATVQDCGGAIPICQNVYHEANSWVGEGNYPNEINSMQSCTYESYSVWYTFTAQTSGNFSFILTPNNTSGYGDDYDWSVFNLTNATCADIYNNPGLEVSCNSYGEINAFNGPTGASSAMGGYGNHNGPGNTFGPVFNADLPVVAGNIYVMMVSNWTGSPYGYTIDFSSSTAQIFDNVPPYIESIISNINCGTNSITFEFSENILCSTIAACDLNLTGPGGPYNITNITGASCASGGTQERIFTINVSPPITTTGAYSLNLNANSCNSVTDLCGNVAPSGSLAFNVTAITTNISVQNAICGQNNGSATVTASGGSGNFTYSWSTSPPQYSANATNLAPGTYTVSVSDGSCTSTSSATILNTGGFTLQTSVINDICGQSNGSATVTASGGSGNYTYQWSTIPVQTLATATNIPAGNYSVTVYDGSCGETAMAVITDNSNLTAAMGNTQNETCGMSDGSATVIASGGSGNYTYHWSTTPVQTLATATNLSTGTYYVTVIDGTCNATATAVIADNANLTAAMGNTQNETCSMSDGSATVIASGGSGNYTYHWSTTPVQTLATATNLSAGTYYVTVIDGTCSATASAVITNNAILNAVISNIQNETCGMSDGSATVTVNAGSQPYQYSWNTNPAQTTATASNLSAGSYTVTVSDASGCSAILNAVIIVGDGPVASIISINAHCDQADGAATVTASGGGSGVYSYLWSNGDTTATINNLLPGVYTVTVDDGYCDTSATVAIANQPGPVAEFWYHPNPIIIDHAQVVFTSGSESAVAWAWDFGDGTGQYSGQSVMHPFYAVDDYQVTLIVTDEFGCSDTITQLITVHDIFTIYIPSSFTPNGDGLNDVFEAYGISWEPGIYKMIIYDRWGNIIYQTTDPSKPWNGGYENNPSRDSRIPGVYVYRITVKGLNDREMVYVGRVTLFR